MNIQIQRGWMPDLAPFGVPEGGLVTAKNLLPFDDKYVKVQDKQTYSSAALADTAQSAKEFKLVSGTRHAFIGTASKLYRLETNKSLTDKSVAGGYTTGTNRWNFEQYGDTVLATNYTDAVQKFANFGGAGAFVALGGSPPKAKYMLLYKGYLILAYVNDGTAYPKKIQWSGLEAIESWTASLLTGADSQSFPDGKGDITGIAKVADFFAVFHENSINVGYFSGAPYTFSFQHNRVENIGCFVPGSLVSIGHACLFWGEDDIYSFNGQVAESIGYGVKEEVINNLNIGALNKVTAMHDPGNGLVLWAYPTGSNSSANRVLVYNYRTRKYTQLELDMECIFSLHTGATDMDSIDSLYADISDMPYSMDSRLYQANSTVIACVDTDLYIDTLEGTDLMGTIETGEVKDGDKVVMVDNVRPRIDNARADVNVRVGSRFDENDSPTYTSSTTVGSNGYANLRSTGRYHRVEVQTTDHDGIHDIEVNAVSAGMR